MEATTIFSTRNFLSKGGVITLQVIGIVVLVTNIILSSLSMIIIRVTKQMETTSNRIIFYVNLSDLGTALYRFLILLLIFDHNKTLYSVEFELAVQYITCQVSYFSAYVVCTLALDRYLHLKYLKDVAVKFTNRNVDMLIALAFLLSIAFATMLTVETVNTQYAGLCFVRYSITIVLFLMTILFYLLTMRTMQQHRNEAVHKENIGKLSKTVTVVSSAYIFSIFLFYAPILLMLILTRAIPLNSGRKNHLELIFQLAIQFAQLNTIFNALMYLKVNGKAKKLLQTLFGKSQ